jgi:hypothetical protein
MTEATSAYMAGRKKYGRPQALLFANNPGRMLDGRYVPFGEEGEDFIVLSDDNRSPITINAQRIESRRRMVNGTMRSYHIADKWSVGCSWTMLPSRSFARKVLWDLNGKPTNKDGCEPFTTDAGAGGVELTDWYEKNNGPFYVYMGYDKFDHFTFGGEITDDSFNFLPVYNDIKLMYFTTYDYTVEKRGQQTYDFWTINLSLEEA